jgi:replicative DNA helicase
MIENARAGDFSTQPNATIFSKMAEMLGNGLVVDRNTLMASLRFSPDLLQRAGGETYVRSLEAVPFVDLNMRSLIQILREYTIGRKLMALGTKIQTDARQGARSQDVLNQAETYLNSLGEYSDDRGSLLDPKEIIARAGGVEKLFNPYGNDKGIVPPWRELEETVGGLHGGELLVIGARPGLGKTSMAIQIMLAAATKGKVVAYFSHEMRDAAILRREICGISSVPAKDVRNNQATREQRRMLNDALDTVIPLPLYITDVAGRNVLQMKAEIRRLQARIKQKVDLVIIDHVQLMRGLGTFYANPTQQLTEISGDLKEYTLKSDSAMIVLSQLNRDNEKREGGRPGLQDLRSSGSLEQDADGVWLIHRPEFYAKDDPTLKDKVVLIVAKQREGDLRDIELKWNGAYTRFESRPEAA